MNDSQLRNEFFIIFPICFVQILTNSFVSTSTIYFLLLTNISFVFDWVIYFALLLSCFFMNRLTGFGNVAIVIYSIDTQPGVESNCVVSCVHVLFVFHSSSTVQCWFNLIENNEREKDCKRFHLEMCCFCLFRFLSVHASRHELLFANCREIIKSNDS